MGIINDIMESISIMTENIVNKNIRLFDELDEGGHQMLTRKELIEIHKVIVKKYNITFVVKDNILDSLLHSIEYAGRNNKWYNAAKLFYDIVHLHPFADGNKRTGLLACKIYLNINNISFEYPKSTQSFTYSMAADLSDPPEVIENLEAWLRASVEKNA